MFFCVDYFSLGFSSGFVHFATTSSFCFLMCFFIYVVCSEVLFFSPMFTGGFSE